MNLMIENTIHDYGLNLFFENQPLFLNYECYENIKISMQKNNIFLSSSIKYDGIRDGKFRLFFFIILYDILFP